MSRVKVIHTGYIGRRGPRGESGVQPGEVPVTEGDILIGGATDALEATPLESAVADTAAVKRVDPGADGDAGDMLRIGPDGTPSFTPSGYFDASDFGAVADSATDNAVAFTALAAAVNAVPNPRGVPVIAHFPGNANGLDYLYSGGLAFTRPVILTGSGRLNHTGTGHAVTFGPDTLDDTNYMNHKRYGAHGLTFTGGASQSHGLYFADHVVEPRLARVSFEAFGNRDGYAVYFQADNWDILMDACDWYTPSSDSTGRNWVRVNGRHATSTGHASRVAGETDGGNSHFRAVACQGTNLNTGGGSGSGVGFWIDGVAASVDGCVLSGFEPNLRLGLQCKFPQVDGGYFEIIRTNAASACIEFGDLTGSGVVFAPKITRCHFNVHNTDWGLTAYPIGYASAGMGLQAANVFDCYVASLAAGREMIRLDNISGQTGNAAGNNTGVGLIHTSGSNIAGWGGWQGNLPTVGGHADASTYLRVQGGWSANQYAGVQLLRANGTVGATIARNPFNNDIEITNAVDGKTWFLKANGGLSVPGGLGVNGVAPIARRTVNAAATDPATTMALVNQLRQLLIDLGLAS